MPKAYLFKYATLACWACLLQSPAWAQLSLGEIIEKTKNEKLSELQGKPSADTEPQAQIPSPATATPLPLPPTPAPKPRARAPAAPVVMPVLWSLSGLNNNWVAEVWLNQAIHRFQVVPGHALPGGWKVMSGDGQSLTLAKGRLVKSLTPAAMGSTGAEFDEVQKNIGFEANMREFARTVESIGAPLPAFGNRGNSPAVNAAGNLPPSR